MKKRHSVEQIVAKQLRALEKENGRLKKVVADQVLARSSRKPPALTHSPRAAATDAEPALRDMLEYEDPLVREAASEATEKVHPR